MHIRLDPDGRFRIQDTENFRTFSVVDASNLERDTVAAALSAVGRLEADGAHVWLPSPWIVGLMSPPAPEAWRERFAEMIQAVRKFGWVDEERDMIRAHVERPGESKSA